VDAAKKCSDAFVELYLRYNDFGQFVNVETGEMLFGGTTSGASVIGALVKAWEFFGEAKYLETATLAGEKYYRDFVAQGITYGGPGEALCAPDSESAYAMVESMVLLYKALKDEKWLRYACDSLHLLSSWVMCYSYKFPEGSEFARLNINTVGSVFANVQNKHSAPGLCTASGDAIYELYKLTGNREYLELLRDIVFFIPQCVSTKARPIRSWNRIPQTLLPGWICERVNTSDWEGKKCVGGVFYFSCWCETSLLLSFSELIWNDEIYKDLTAF
jgi:hypothetical protein